MTVWRSQARVAGEMERILTMYIPDVQGSGRRWCTELRVVC